LFADVTPRSGGTCIWPTSPQRLYRTLDHEQSHGFHPNASYLPALRAIIESVPPVEFVGGAGRVISDYQQPSVEGPTKIEPKYR
jgi:hypothetical protein